MSTNHEFDADINQLLNIIINALYSNKDVFLRELISNASDAIEKHRLTSLQENVIHDESSYFINCYTEPNTNYLVVCDNGIGMSEEETITNLGTIAESGTKSFIEQVLKDNETVSQIGQFGVGFYSSFLVADEVTVITEQENENCVNVWSSDGSNSFETSSYEECSDIELYNNVEYDGDDFVEGTYIIMDIESTEQDYLNKEELLDIIEEHSQFIKFPINFISHVEEEVVDEEQLEVVDKEQSEVVDEELEEIKDESSTQEKQEEKITVEEESIVNSQEPIWNRCRDEITTEEYEQFYEALNPSDVEPSYYKHFETEGELEYDCIIYLPTEAELDMFNDQSSEKCRNFKLYCNGVFVMDDSSQLLPEWLEFTCGIIDCKNIQLNVSRETLQDTAITKSIKDNIVNESIDVILELQKNNEEFTSFYEHFEKNIELGIHTDVENREELAQLLEYNHLNYFVGSSKETSGDNENPQFVTLDEYISSSDNSIYYLSGQNLECLVNSPYIEHAEENEYNVILMVDPLDEFISSSFTEYKGEEFVCLSKQQVDKEEEDDSNYLEFFESIESHLGSDVESVSLSSILKESPCIITTSQHGWSANFERILNAQALRDKSYDQFMEPEEIFELNVEHPIIDKLFTEFNSSESLNTNVVDSLYYCALLNGGFTIENTQEITQSFISILSEYYNVDFVPIVSNSSPIDSSNPLDELRNPLDELRNPLDEHSNPLDEHSNPLDEHSGNLINEQSNESDSTSTTSSEEKISHETNTCENEICKEKCKLN